MTVANDAARAEKTGGIIKELLKAPVLKSGIKTALNSIDPASGPRLARSVIWQDPEIILAVLAALPAVSNTVISLLDKMFSEISEKFTPELFEGYLKSLVGNIDKEAFERTRVSFQKYKDIFLKCYDESRGGSFQNDSGTGEAVDGRVKIKDEPGGGILKELTQSPVLKELIRNFLNNIDPDNASNVVKNLVWGDAEMILSVIGASPLMINWLVTASYEFGNQLSSKFPPMLIYGFFKAVFEQIDKERLKNTVDIYKKIVLDLFENNPEFSEAILKSVKETAAPAAGRGVNAALKYLNRLQKEDPQAIADIVQALTSQIDNMEFKGAMMGIINPVLDRISYIKVGYHFITGRIRYKLRRKKNRAQVR